MCDNSILEEKKDVALYARVSTEHEAQLYALDNQIDWYKAILAQHPEWNLVGMYIDRGITGTAAYKRPQFMQMIQDAENHKFSLILTREVSRFARNTVDTLQYTRKLKAKGIEVYFINDNIHTFDGDGELRLTIMATLAQDESRKTSIRVKSGQQTSMEKGVVYGNGNILGYNRVDGKMIINPEQAKTVRMIYDFYLDGMGLKKIKDELELRGRLTAMGNREWHCSTISQILKNSFYCGIMEYHKQYVADFLEQKKKKNLGEIERISVRGSHEPIVTEEEFNKVQKIMGSRRKEVKSEFGKRKVGSKTKSDVWCCLLKCSCGHDFNRKVWGKYKGKDEYAYQCYAQIKSGSVKTRLAKGLPIDNICEVPMVPRWKLQMMAKYIFRNYLSNTDEVLSLANSLLADHIEDEEPVEDNTTIIEQKQSELTKMQNRLSNLIEMRADGEITREIFKIKKKEVEDKIFSLQKEIGELLPDEPDYENDVDYEDKLKVLRYALEQYVDFSSDDDIPEDVVEAFVEKIVAYKDRFDWYLRFSPDDDPKRFTVEGKKGNANIKNVPPGGGGATTPNLDSCNKWGMILNKECKHYVKIASFTLDNDYVRAYRRRGDYSRNNYINDDVNINLYI